MKDIYDRLSGEFDLSGWKEQRKGQYFFMVPKKQARSLITRLKEVEGFGHLIFFSAVDHIEEGVFHLLYLLHSYEKKTDFGVYVEISRENAEMESIHDLWPAAKTYQRELREMFGVNFPGSPGVDDNFVLEGWEDLPPMRRDFDTKEYSEKTYYPRPGRRKTDNREALRDKLYPSEAEQW